MLWRENNLLKERKVNFEGQSPESLSFRTVYKQKMTRCVADLLFYVMWKKIVLKNKKGS